MADKSDSDYVSYFHHTDKESAKQIIKSEKILQSTDTKNDAVKGVGTYVTTHGPDKGRSAIAENNYDGIAKSKVNKTDVAFEMKIPKSKVTDHSKSMGRDVHVHKGDINLREVKEWKVHVRETGGDKYKTFEPAKQAKNK